MIDKIMLINLHFNGMAVLVAHDAETKRRKIVEFTYTNNIGQQISLHRYGIHQGITSATETQDFLRFSRFDASVFEVKVSMCVRNYACGCLCECAI